MNPNICLISSGLNPIHYNNDTLKDYMSLFINKNNNNQQQTSASEVDTPLYILL